MTTHICYHPREARKLIDAWTEKCDECKAIRATAGMYEASKEIWEPKVTVNR